MDTKSHSFLKKNSVLVLNSLYMAIGVTTIQKAVVAMNSAGDEPSAKAIDIVYPLLEDGSYDLENGQIMGAYNFDEWLMTDLRGDLDRVIHTSRMQVRCPTVITTSYDKMPKRRIKATKSVLYEAQGGRCGYSGKKLPFKRMNLEHKVPKSYGGKDTFENLMVVDEEINSRRGNKPLEDLGLKPLFHHKTPKPIPASCTIKTIAHPDWKLFIG